MRAPWNASWTGESQFEIRRCRYAEGHLAMWQKHAPGEGQPLFAEPHLTRQRKSIVEWRCTVCGERTCYDDRWWFNFGERRGDHFMTTEAPVHLACARLAMTLCPELKKREVEPEPFPMDGVRIFSSVVNLQCLHDFGIKREAMPAAPVIGALKLGWNIQSPFIARMLERKK